MSCFSFLCEYICMSNYVYKQFISVLCVCVTTGFLSLIGYNKHNNKGSLYLIIISVCERALNTILVVLYVWSPTNNTIYT